MKKSAQEFSSFSSSLHFFPFKFYISPNITNYIINGPEVEYWPGVDGIESYEILFVIYLL